MDLAESIAIKSGVNLNPNSNHLRSTSLSKYKEYGYQNKKSIFIRR